MCADGGFASLGSGTGGCGGGVVCSVAVTWVLVVEGRSGRIGGRQVGFEGAGVAQGCVDVDAEQFADASDVAAGGADLVEDAVFAEGLRGEADVVRGEAAADRREPGCGASVDEQVRVDRVGPGRVLRWSSQAARRGSTGAARGMLAAVDGEAAVDDVGELDDSEVLRGDARGTRRGRQRARGGVGRVERGADRGGVERERDRWCWCRWRGSPGSGRRRRACGL